MKIWKRFGVVLLGLLFALGTIIWLVTMENSPRKQPLRARQVLNTIPERLSINPICILSRGSANTNFAAKTTNQEALRW